MIDCTVGAELEWPDVDPQVDLPPGWAWSTTDYTIVNSDGTANDPQRKLFRGGELNTPPFDHPVTLAAEAAKLWDRLQPGHNYRSNLHVHIGAEFDLESLKIIADYTRAWLPGLLPVIDPLEPLAEGLSGKERAAAIKRLKHSRRSRHFFISQDRHMRRMVARTVDQLLACEVPMSRGKPQWHLAPREAVNLRSLRKHGTIEFRHFAGPQSADELQAACEFAVLWVNAALQDRPPNCGHLVDRLPKQVRFDHRLELGWERSNLQHNRREAVERWMTGTPSGT